MIVTAGQTCPSPKEFRELEEAMLGQTGSREAAWVGRGATALYYALRVARALGNATDVPEVIVPSVACHAIVNACCLAGVRPKFADVDIESGLAALNSIKARYTVHTKAVVFVHLYGATADLRALAAWCRSKGIVLIEDNAQALGATLPCGTPVGGLGDLSVFSFSPGKVAGHGGGLLLVRTEETAKVLGEVLARHPLFAPLEEGAALALASSYRDLQRAAVALLRQGRSAVVSDSFRRLRPAYDDLYLRPFSGSPSLPDLLRSLPQNLELRRRKAESYGERLQGGPWRLLDGWRASGVCWRFSLLLDTGDRCGIVSEMMRRRGFDVSNLFWPLHELFDPGESCPEAERYGRRVINLWVDDTVDYDRVETCAQSLKELV